MTIQQPTSDEGRVTKYAKSHHAWKIGTIDLTTHPFIDGKAGSMFSCYHHLCLSILQFKSKLPVMRLFLEIYIIFC